MVNMVQTKRLTGDDVTMLTS